MPTHSSILAWTVDPGGLQPTGSQESDMTKQQQQQHICIKWILKKNKKWILSSICIGSEDIHISHVTYNASMFSKKPLLNIHFISFSSDSEPVSYHDLSYFFNISQVWFLLCYLVRTLFLLNLLQQNLNPSPWHLSYLHEKTSSSCFSLSLSPPQMKDKRAHLKYFHNL